MMRALLLAEMLTICSLAGPAIGNAQTAAPGAGPVTPIEHLVIIFQENISFDHYFGTYPYALNTEGEPAFTPLPGTPSVNGLTASLMTNNPNAYNAGNGTGMMNPFRLDRSQAATTTRRSRWPFTPG
jgi:phospholipase C